MVQLQQSKQLAVSNGVKALVYGRSGMGKTLLNATAPNPVVISAEGGLLSLSQKNIERVFGVNTPGITYNLPVIEISNLDDLVDAYNWTQQSHEAKQFETFSLDSLSEIGEQVLNNAKKTVKDPRQAYGQLLEQMADTIRLFRDLKGKNVYFSSKQIQNKDDATGMTLFGPSMPGQRLSQELPYFFDEVLCLRVGQTPEGEAYRYLQTQPDFQYDAKDRSGSLDLVEMPNLKHVFDKIQGANHGAT